MESLFFNLLQILNALDNNLKEMHKATEKHNLALKNNDIEGIKDALKELDTLSAQSKSLDKKREEIQSNLELALGLSQGASLSDTIAKAPAKIAQDLDQAATSLRETTAAIADLVQLNKILTQQGMQFNDVLLKVIRPAQATYNPSGQTAGTSGKAASLLNKTI